jgi:hypothetical protein
MAGSLVITGLGCLVEIDVRQLDEVASELKVAMTPTFALSCSGEPRDRERRVCEHCSNLIS